MKKLIFLVILLTVQFSFAQFYKADVTFSNGSVKSGYAEPVNTEKTSINFKETLDGKKEKLELKSLAKVHYFDEKTGKEAEAERLTATQGRMSSEAFLYLIYKGEISVYAQSSNFYDKSSLGNYATVRSVDTSYFFRYKDEKKVTLISMNFEGGLVVPIGMKKITQKGIKDFFSDKCPKLITAYENEEIKFKKDVMVFVEYYEKNCNK